MSAFPIQINAARITNHPRFPLAFAFFGVCLVIGLILWFGMPAPPEPVKALPPDPFQDPAAGMAHIQKLAQRYGGDFDRLSADDKLFLNAIAMGHGRELLQKTVKEIKSAPASKTFPPAP